MRVFLIGLRRSGTTTLFELFRQDARLVCFDEPFNPMIRDVPARDEWGTKSEYIDLYNKRPDLFWRKYAYIDGLDEIRDGLTSQQSDWTAYLLNSAPNTFMDFTRVHFKLADLHSLDSDALLIHLHRSPAAFASSHILPGVWKKGRRFKYWRQKRRFWNVVKKYNTWGMETIIGRSDSSRCAERFRQFDLDPGLIYSANAVTRLTAFWLLNFRAAHQEGRRLFPRRYLQIPFEQFTRNPAAYMEEIYRCLDTDLPRFDYSAIKIASKGALPDHGGWRRVRDVLGVDPQCSEYDHDLIL